MAEHPTHQIAYFVTKTENSTSEPLTASHYVKDSNETNKTKNIVTKNNNVIINFD